ncbi:hypothetical protein BDZ89DRAFT_1116320 [Hymenopellis radicata]|nr:hypothetical protein BDZ89DRAFT_1116320 [Hymenopellis radicata]
MGSENLPKFNDWVNVVVDSDNGQLVMYGGTAVDDGESNQFHILDIETMTWKPLPKLIKATFELFKTSTGRRFVLSFGGVESPSGETSSKIVAIDLDQLVWFYVRVQGGEVTPRVNVAMVVVKNRLYIFGGRDEIDAEANSCRSYSIAEYDDDNGWSWIAADVPYAAEVDVGYDGTVIPIYDGLKILLGPGRQRVGKQRVSTSSRPLVLVPYEHRTFSALPPLVGALPDVVSWYWMQAAAAINDGSRSDDAVIAGWVQHRTEDLVPDIWRFNFEDETISCLNLRSHIGDLDLDLHCFAAFKDRFLLLGHDNAVYEAGGTRATDENGELTISPLDARFNVIVDIDPGSFKVVRLTVKIGTRLSGVDDSRRSPGSRINDSNGVCNNGDILVRGRWPGRGRVHDGGKRLTLPVLEDVFVQEIVVACAKRAVKKRMQERLCRRRRGWLKISFWRSQLNLMLLMTTTLLPLTNLTCTSHTTTRRMKVYGRTDRVLSV